MGPLLIVFATTRSVWALTGWLSVARLLSPSGSVVAASTVATLVIVRPAMVGSSRTVICTTTISPSVRSPRPHASPPPSAGLQLPAAFSTDTTVTPSGRASVTVTSRASDGPWLITVST